MPTIISPKDLTAAVTAGFKELKLYRDRFKSTCEEYGGGHLGRGDNVRRPINLIAQGAGILLANLINEEPKHRVRSPLAELRFEARMLELALDRLWQTGEVLAEVTRGVLDAILGPIGIFRMGMRVGKDAVTIDPGISLPLAEPFCRRVSLDDYACDPAARSRRELKWEAIRYRIPRQEAIDSGIFGRNPEDYGPDEQPIADMATRDEAAEILRTIPGLSTANTQTDVADIGKDASSPQDRYGLIDTIELWDVFFYGGDETWTITVPASHDPTNAALGTQKWLLVEKWEGPDTGPVLVIGFHDMPDSPLFKPVAADWRDLHDFCQIVSAKLGREAENAKVVWGYKPGGQDDAMAVKQKRDSGLVAITAEAPTKIEVNGIIESLMPMLEWGERKWADASGNLPLTGGQNSEATDQTATAAQYLQANASQRILKMRQRVDALLKAIDRYFGWYLTTDPLVKLPLPYRVPGGETITVEYDASTRRGDFLSYNFDVERYSAVGQDPNVRLKRVVDFLNLTQQVFLPLAQVGLGDIQGWSRLGQQEFGIENLDEIFGPQPGMQMQMEAHMQRAAVPPPGQPMMQPSQGMPAPVPPPGGGGPPAAPDNAQQTPVDVGRSALAA